LAILQKPRSSSIHVCRLEKQPVLLLSSGGKSHRDLHLYAFVQPCSACTSTSRLLCTPRGVYRQDSELLLSRFEAPTKSLFEFRRIFYLYYRTNGSKYEPRGKWQRVGYLCYMCPLCTLSNSTCSHDSLLWGLGCQKRGHQVAVNIRCSRRTVSFCCFRSKVEVLLNSLTIDIHECRIWQERNEIPCSFWPIFCCPTFRIADERRVVLNRVRFWQILLLLTSILALGLSPCKSPMH